jgi:hypothetical protein
MKQKLLFFSPFFLLGFFCMWIFDFLLSEENADTTAQIAVGMSWKGDISTHTTSVYLVAG